MARPSFVGAGTGVVSTGTTIAATKTGCTVGNLIMLHVATDGGNNFPGLGTCSGVKSLAGVVDSMSVGISGSDGPALITQHAFLGIATSTSVSCGATSTGDDLYARVYEFADVNTGGDEDNWGFVNVSKVWLHSSGIQEASQSSGQVVTTVTDPFSGIKPGDAECLAVALIALSDDNPILEFTGESGGNWIEPVAEFASATGTDAAIGIQTALPTWDTLLDGGSFTMAADNYTCLGLMLMPVWHPSRVGNRGQHQGAGSTSPGAPRIARPMMSGVMRR